MSEFADHLELLAGEASLGRPSTPEEYEKLRDWLLDHAKAVRSLQAEVEKLRSVLDPRSLNALRLELPGAVWDDAIAPILAALPEGTER